MVVIVEILTYLSVTIGLVAVASGSMELGRRYFAKKNIDTIKRRLNDMPLEQLNEFLEYQFDGKRRVHTKYYRNYGEFWIGELLDKISVSDIREIEGLEKVLIATKQIIKNQRD